MEVAPQSEVVGVGQRPLALLDPRHQPRSGVTGRLEVLDLGHLARVEDVRFAELGDAVRHRVELALVHPAEERLEARDVKIGVRGGDVRRRAFDQRVVFHAPDYRRPSSSTASEAWKRAIWRTRYTVIRQAGARASR